MVLNVLVSISSTMLPFHVMLMKRSWALRDVQHAELLANLRAEIEIELQFLINFVLVIAVLVSQTHEFTFFCRKMMCS